MKFEFLLDPRTRKSLLGIQISAALALAAGTAVAQPQLEEIVVTAQKREQNIQDVGVSVTAMSGDELKKLGVVSSTDIGKIAPGVVFAQGGSGSVLSTLSVRGITQSSSSPHNEAPNSIYVDEIYLSSPSAVSFPIYDLQRVEVLRGPQGTMFGRNATGGLVHFVTARPSETYEGYAELGYGAYNQGIVEGAVSGPLSDRIRARVSARGEQNDAWWKNREPGGKDAFNSKFWGVRGQLDGDISENLSALLSLSYDKSPETREGTYKSSNYYVNANGDPAPLPIDLDAYGTGPGNNAIGYRDPYSDARSGAFNDTGYLERRRDSQTLRLEWTPADLTVTSLTNRTYFEMDYGYEDFDGSPIEYASGPLTQELDQWSQEIRVNGNLDNLVWTAGFYYLDMDSDSSTGFVFPVLSGTDYAFNSSNFINQTTKSYSLFGQTEWSFTDELRLITGLRYTHDEIEFDSKAYFNELGNAYSGGTGSTVFEPPLLVADFSSSTVGGDATQEDGLWSGKVQLDYLPADGTLLYAGVSRGVKGPGFNGNIDGSLPDDRIPFDSESMIAYEIGGKFDLLDRQLRVNASAFYYDYTDFQGFAFVNTQGQVGNYDGTYYGGELEFLVLLPGDVTIRLAGSYIDSELEDVPSVYYGLRDVEGNLATKWLANGSIEKMTRLGSGELAMQWSFNFIGDHYSSVDNNAVTEIDESLQHDARISYVFDGSGIELAAFVINITDEEREVFNFDFLTSGYRLASYAPPRWWGVSVRKSF